MTTTLFVAAKALIIRDGKLLLLRESSAYADGTNEGRYDVPGGRIDPAESLIDALMREVKEETGLTLATAVPFSAGEWWPKKNGEQWHIVGIYHAVRVEPGKVVLSDDHDHYIWADLDDLPATLIDLYRPLLAQNRDFLKKF